MALVTVRGFGTNKGVFIHRVQSSGTARVRGSSAVFASVAEWVRGEAKCNMGLAVCRVLDVVPGVGFVDVRIDITWRSVVNYRVTLLIEEE
ncbi:MAG: hypothetical protein H8F28_22885 [Fibrella sp.]|nr:hypothetical protein [Armatimonadota bacterium]